MMKKRILSMLLLVCGMTTGTWALNTDADGYYLIGTLQDWKDFATIVNSGFTTINARMTDDIDLGDDQTMVGRSTKKYAGIFDGQGHKLTINYDTQDMEADEGQGTFIGAAPFRDIEGATIRNLYTTGTITADKIGASGLVGWAYGTNTIACCWSDVNIIGTDKADTFSALVFRQDGSQLDIIDCLYTGKIASAAKKSHAGFVGHQVAGTTNVTNSLVVLAEGSDESNESFYTFVRNWYYNTPVNITNSYYLRPWGTLQGTAATAEQLADGTTTTALQAGRDEKVWVQNSVMKQPILYIFADFVKKDDVYYLGSATDLHTFAEGINDGTIPADAKARVTANIDLAGNTENQWTPIGTASHKFIGTFDGQGYTINVLYFKQEVENIGLFGFTGPGAYIKNVRVIGMIDITNADGSNAAGKNVRAAGIVAHAEGGIILNCSFSGTVASYSHTGGIVGYALGGVKVVNCYNEGIVMAPSNALQELGGIIGRCDNGQAINCYNVGDVKNTANGNVILSPTSTSQKDCYFRTNCCQTTSSASWSNGKGNGTAVSATDMRKEDFVSTLNANVEALRATYPDICEWQTTQYGYPVHVNKQPYETAVAVWHKGYAKLFFSYGEVPAPGGAGRFITTSNGKPISVAPTNVWSGSQITASTTHRAPAWYTIVKEGLKTVQFDPVFATVRPTSCYHWFPQCRNLNSFIGWENLNTSEVTSMGWMFSGCSNSALTMLDLSTFDTRNVENMVCMFSGCSNLAGVIVGDNWDTSRVTKSDGMFNNNTKIVGEDGTKYIPAATNDKTYAHTGAGGYLTKMAVSVPLTNMGGTYWGSYYKSSVNRIADQNTVVFGAYDRGDYVDLYAIPDRIIKAGQGVVLKSATNTVTLTSTTTAATENYYTNNILKGYDVNTVQPTSGNNYALTYQTGDNPQLGLGKMSGSASLTANSAYYLTDTTTGPDFYPFSYFYIKGDANGDGKVTITDAVAIVDYILGNKPENFYEEAANVSGDRDSQLQPVITITDAVGVVDIILNDK